MPRQIAMYLLRQEVNYSLPQIGEVLGGRDHTTVMYGCEKIAEMLETDDRFKKTGRRDQRMDLSSTLAIQKTASVYPKPGAESMDHTVMR